MDAENYTVDYQTPSVATYQHLRSSAGLSKKDEAAASAGLANLLFRVTIIHQNSLVAMGRVIGDGGCFFQVVDVAVLPDHQRKGLGKKVMAEILNFIQLNVPPIGYVSLLADGQAHSLYEHFGFRATAGGHVSSTLTMARQ